MLMRTMAVIFLGLCLMTPAEAKRTCFDAALTVKPGASAKTCSWQRSRHFDPVYRKMVWKRSRTCQ
jgi:hypothetical protein